jgi:hypothetical protein
MWKISWEESSRQMQENLKFLTLAFALRRAVDDVDLLVVREILKSAAQLHLLEHPLFTQALEFLERASC